MAISKLIFNGVTQMDVTGTTAVVSDVAQGKKFILIDGTEGTGTGSGGGGGGSVTQDQDGYIVLPSTGGGGSPSATQHEIYFEFSDSTDTTITAWYDGTFISDAITATTPTTYGGKTVTLAQLDGVTWFNPSAIPIGVQLIDYSAATNNYVIDSSGAVVPEQWYSVSDYTPIASGMTFTFSGCRWFYASYYDSSKDLISVFYINTYTTQSPYDSNIGDGTLSSGIPANAAYIRISSIGNPDEHELSLIRTA